MNKNAKEWVKALRSGEYGQCRGTLTNGRGFCCLGVAVDLYIQTKKNLDKDGHHKLYWEKYLNSSSRWRAESDESIVEGVLPDEVKKWLGLRTNDGSFYSTLRDCPSLAQLNDEAKLSFEKIADIIELEPEGLFEN